MKTQYTACLEKDGAYWIGYVREIPGVNTQGRTKAETRKNLREALQLILESNRELAEKRSKGQKIICEPIFLAE